MIEKRNRLARTPHHHPTLTTSPPPPTTPTHSHHHLRHVLSSTPTAASTLLGLSSPRFRDLPIGASIEVSPVAFKLARQVGQLISGRKKPEPFAARETTDVKLESDSVGGCGLIIDYGGDKVYGNSFRVSERGIF